MKKLLILFMPFFMVCCKQKVVQNNLFGSQKDTIMALMAQIKTPNLFDSITLESKWDTLAQLGKRFQWDGNDSNFRSYIAINDQAGNLLWGPRKECVDYFQNIVQYEAKLQSDSLPRYFWNNLYKINAEKFSFKYEEKFLSDFERCYFTQQQHPWLSVNKYYNTLKYLGIIYHILGEKNKALHFYSLALNMAQRTTAPNANIVGASINKYKYFLEYGQPDSVIAHAPALLILKSVAPVKMTMIKAYYAEALYAKDNPLYKKVLDEAWDSLKMIKADADELGKKSDVLKLYGDIALKEKQYLDAIAFYKKALDTCLEKNIKNDDPLHERYYGKLLLRLATVYESLGQYDTALYYSQFALACVTPVDSAAIGSNPATADLYTENTIMEALDCKAGLLEKKYAATKDKNFLENAVTCYNLAFAVEQKLLQNFTYDDSRAAMQKNSKARSGRAIQACYQLYQLTGNNGWAEKAFQFSENSKALILLEAIKKNIHNSKNKDNPLFKRVDSLQLQLTYAERLLNTGKKGDTAIMARKNLLEKALDDALADLDNRELGYKKYRQLEDTAVLLALRKELLTSNRYLAEYFCADSNRYLFVVKQTGNLVFTKLIDSVLPQIDSLMGFFTAQNKKEATEYKQAAFQLFEACGLRTILNAQELLIIPDGPFNQLPFDALVYNNSGDDFQGLEYLFKRTTTSYGYSATSLLQQKDNSHRNDQPIVAFAPGFLNGERQLARLPNSILEVDSIGAQQRYKGEQSTVAKLISSFTLAGTIHIASHASADTSANAEPRIEMYDTSFYMSELYATSLLRTNLVVLSACQTNQGNNNQSEGTLSLARGFYYAGAKNIVASLWNVDDKSTTAIMQAFYGNGNNGQYAAKLREAKLKFLNNETATGRTPPYYWAALMHIGGFNKAPKSSYGWAYGGGAALLMLAVGFLYKRKRKSANK